MRRCERHDGRVADIDGARRNRGGNRGTKRIGLQLYVEPGFAPQTQFLGVEQLRARFERDVRDANRHIALCRGRRAQ
jgi:hypothetical protein